MEETVTAEENIKLLHRILSITWGNGYEDGLFFRPSGDGSVTIHVHLNDVFDWACSDCEDLTLENLPDFEKALSEVKELNPNNVDACHDAAILFACRIRQQRPFKHFDEYPVNQSLWPLIDAMPYPVRKP